MNRAGSEDGDRGDQRAGQRHAWKVCTARAMIGHMTRRLAAGFVVVLVLFACKRERASKNDDIAACQSTGGQWVEGGCNDSGRCEKTTGAAPDDEDEDEIEDDPND